MADFIDELVAEAKEIDPDCLCTFTNFPPTEFLRPQSVDFVCFNVYLHEQQPFKSYLARLQMIADSKPLVLGEFGIDSLREGEPLKCEILSWQIETAFRSGLSRHGSVQLYGRLVARRTAGRRLGDGPDDSRPAAKGFSFRAVQNVPSRPLFSAATASARLGGRRELPVARKTLKTCLDSLERLNYDDYEVIFWWMTVRLTRRRRSQRRIRRRVASA